MTQINPINEMVKNVDVVIGAFDTYSSRALLQVLSILNNKIFISSAVELNYGLIDIYVNDGEHTEEGTVDAFVRYYDFINSPGLVMFHDINAGPVKDSWHKCRDGKEWSEFIFNDSAPVFGIGIIYK